MLNANAIQKRDALRSVCGGLCKLEAAKKDIMSDMRMAIMCACECWNLLSHYTSLLKLRVRVDKLGMVCKASPRERQRTLLFYSFLFQITLDILVLRCNRNFKVVMVGTIAQNRVYKCIGPSPLTQTFNTRNN